VSIDLIRLNWQRSFDDEHFIEIKSTGWPFF